MSHTYLIDLYALVDQRLEDVDKLCTESGAETDYLKGRSASLRAFKQFLKTHYNRKLPRRLRGKYE
ncbi:MAG: hypothetical protein ABFR63_09350 [Thermodesulfobacteriota bacterium]